MQLSPLRFALLLFALAAVGFGVGYLVLSRSSRIENASTTSVLNVPAPATARARSDTPTLSTSPNPAAQKGGPPNPIAEKTAAIAAQDAARAAAELAAK